MIAVNLTNSSDRRFSDDESVLRQIDEICEGRTFVAGSKPKKGREVSVLIVAPLIIR